MYNPVKVRNRIIYIIVAASLLIIVVSDIIQLYELRYLIVAMIVLYFVCSPLFWRCPSCKEMLPFRVGQITNCPYCGKAFDESEADNNKNN